MKVREIIKKVCNYLQLDEVKQYLIDLEKYEQHLSNIEPTLDDEIKSNLTLLLECANNVCVHIATNYIPLYNQEKLTITDNKISIDSLTQKLFKVKKIINKSGYVKFTIIDKNIVCDNGEVSILYSYYPSSFEMTDEIIDFNGKVSLFGYCYGIASEYCLSKGDYEQAYFWDDKYKELLKNSAKRIDYLKLKSRRWF